MGGALLAAWLRAGVKPASVTVVDPHIAELKHLPEGIQKAASLADVGTAFDCIVLAVKPQSMDGVMAQLATLYSTITKPVFLSIAAGKTLAYFKKSLPHSAIVRAMPNTPSIIGKGISALVANDRTSDSQKALAETLLNAAGKTVWLQQESQMDAVTAVSGSGPAYMFYFLEQLIDAGKAQGLPDEICRQLALHTMLGSAELASQASETLTQLRKNVTSPGGTTEAALGVFMKNDALKSLIHKAVWQAAKRAKELA